MNTRNWPIRSKIIALAAVPLAALLVLWIFATTLTVGPASSLLASRTIRDGVGRPGETLVAELQQERRLSLVYLALRGGSPELTEQRTRTDRAVGEFRRKASGGSLRRAASDLLDARLDQTFTALDGLASGRGFIDQRALDKTGALGLYSSMIDSLFRSFDAATTVPDEELTRQARALAALGQAREVLSQSDALLSGVFTAGKFAETEYGQLVQIIGTQRFLYAAAVADLPEADRTAYQKLSEGSAFVQLRSLEETVVAKGRTGAAPPIAAKAWRDSHDSVQQQLRDFESKGADVLADKSGPVAAGILTRLGLAGVLGLIAVILSALIALRVGRSLIGRITGLRAAALELANERLPAVVTRLRNGEEVDVARAAPPLEYGSDELGQLGQAFSDVQRTAVQSAVDEAALRRGLSDVFLNIARRSQTLLHRQLSLLDRMERRTTDPDELSDLFRVDHLSTRMRRHAEDLVILAGAAPGRGWRNPVPMIDVVRGAISEVEDYARVDVTSVQTASAVGRAVGDVIHLLAELIENATSFSPPHTRVRVAGQVVPHGYAVEIEDRGLGMTPEALEAANRRLAEPPDFDPSNSARLGLFVVAQLAARHNVQVHLGPSPYGGVTAVALLPTDLVASGAGTIALPARPAAGAEWKPSHVGRLGSGAQRAGRRAAVALPPSEEAAEPAAPIWADAAAEPAVPAWPEMPDEPAPGWPEMPEEPAPPVWPGRSARATAPRARRSAEPSHTGSEPPSTGFERPLTGFEPPRSGSGPAYAEPDPAYTEADPAYAEPDPAYAEADPVMRPRGEPSVPRARVDPVMPRAGAERAAPPAGSPNARRTGAARGSATPIVYPSHPARAAEPDSRPEETAPRLAPPPAPDRPAAEPPAPAPISAATVSAPTPASPAKPGAEPDERLGQQDLPPREPVGRPDALRAGPLGRQAAPEAQPAAAAAGNATGEPAAASVAELAARRDRAARPDRRPEPPIGPDGLPRRIRQTSLAPQLRDSGPAGAPDAGSAEDTAVRSPEEVRARMSALQAGTARGRRDGAPPNAARHSGPPGVAQGRTGTPVAGNGDGGRHAGSAGAARDAALRLTREARPGSEGAAEAGRGSAAGMPRQGTPGGSRDATRGGVRGTAQVSAPGGAREDAPAGNRGGMPGADGEVVHGPAGPGTTEGGLPAGETGPDSAPHHGGSWWAPRHGNSSEATGDIAAAEPVDEANPRLGRDAQ